jgi:hypothetical protein
VKRAVFAFGSRADENPPFSNILVRSLLFSILFIFKHILTLLLSRVYECLSVGLDGVRDSRTICDVRVRRPRGMKSLRVRED